MPPSWRPSRAGLHTGEVTGLMTSTAAMLEESIVATQQQKSAADQVDTAIQQISQAADSLAAEQAQRAATADRLEELVAEIEAALRAGQQAGAGQAGEAAGAAGWAGPGGDRPVSGNGHVTVTAAAGAVGPAAPSGGPVSSYVQFRVAGEAYAVPTGHVVEVAPPAELTRVPGTRPELAGVRNMRGAILPVIDLAGMLGISRTARPGRVLVAEAGNRQAGFEIDEVDAVRELADPDTRPSRRCCSACGGRWAPDRLPRHPPGVR